MTLEYAVDGVSVSPHAIARWSERVEIGASEGQAETQILNALTAGRVLAQKPDWVTGSWFAGEQYVESADRPGVVLLVSRTSSGSVITTVLVRPDSHLKEHA
ncbi:MAG TPA: hypothetical protein VNF26_01780 [Candidatus Baltobacterales bacterium]|nr:hypothetical protein [Candidatus Baltobacterales bacterium]